MWKGIPTRPADRGQLTDRVDRADLVVGVDDGDQRRVKPEAGFKALRVRSAVAIDGEHLELEAGVLSQVPRRAQDSRVLDGCGQEMGGLAKFPFGQGCAAERQVVAFGSAGCEDDLLGGASQDFRNRAPGVLDGSFGRLAPTMD